MPRSETIDAELRVTQQLHQIIALANGQRTRTLEAVTAIYKKVQKPALFDGLVRSYRPILEDEHELPPEQKNIQAQWRDCMSAAVKHWSQLLDITLTQDSANCNAKSSIKVDGQIIAADVPVTYLLFLEKHLVDCRTFIQHIPVLDTAEEWTWDGNKNCYVTKPQRKIRTRKVPKTLVKYEATEHHPAQTERYDEDVVAGEWHSVLLSGRIRAQDKEQLLARVEQLIEAVKLAREEANRAPAPSAKIANKLFDFIVDGAVPAQT